MSRLKKTNRPHAYPADFKARVLLHAIAVSMESAAREYRVNHQTVKNWMVQGGHKPRRVGNFTLAEIAAQRNPSLG